MVGMSKPKVSSKELRILFAKAKKQGWQIEFTKKCHFKMLAPDGKVMFCPSTPSDFRSLRNVLAEMKRHGYTENK